MIFSSSLVAKKRSWSVRHSKLSVFCPNYKKTLHHYVSVVAILLCSIWIHDAAAKTQVSEAEALRVLSDPRATIPQLIAAVCESTEIPFFSGKPDSERFDADPDAPSAFERRYGNSSVEFDKIDNKYVIDSLVLFMSDVRNISTFHLTPDLIKRKFGRSNTEHHTPPTEVYVYFAQQISIRFVFKSSKMIAIGWTCTT